MTGAVFFRREGRLTGFSVQGHTDDSGSTKARLVCAAVSSAVYLTANTVTDVIGAKADVSVADGALSLRLSEDNAQAETLLEGLLLHLTQLSEQYQSYITIQTEVQHDASY